MSIKNFVAKHGITTGSVVIDAATGAISTSVAGAKQTKINLKIITAEQGSVIIPSGDNTSRDALPQAGYTRFNTVSSSLETFNGSNWVIVGTGNANITSSSGSFITPTGTSSERDILPSIGYLRYNSQLNKLEVYTGSIWEQINTGVFTGGNAFITSSTGSFITPAGTTIQRDALPSSGYIRFNTDFSQLEIYNGVTWSMVGSDYITSPTGSLKTPAGTISERDAVPQLGYLRFNTELGIYEGYDGTQWQPLQLILNYIDGGTYGSSEIPPSVEINGGTF